MRILLSAYACEPGKGSEPEVGYRALLAAAGRHQVWVLTRENNLPVLAEALARHPRRERIHLVGLDVPGLPARLKRRGQAGLHVYYDIWQRHAADRAVRLHRDVSFDVVHHVTFATYWARAGVAAVRKPLIWGPVGGGVGTPMLLIPELGVRGVGEEVARAIILRVMPHLSGARAAARSSWAALAQNRETAARLTSVRKLVLPNATCIDLQEEGVPDPTERASDVVFASRLVPWKGAKLAVRAMRWVRHPGARLYVYGDGPDKGRVEAVARRWGLSDRVVLGGRLPRSELLWHLVKCSALLHPAVHDESPHVMAEALSLRTPVVGLDHGGPAELARRWPDSPSNLVRPGTPSATARRLARALEGFLAHPEPPRGSIATPEPRFEDALLSLYEAAGRGAPLAWGSGSSGQRG